MPDRPGDVFFAQAITDRRDDIVLLVPQTREEAEVRHRDGESYVLAARSTDGLPMLLPYIGVWDRNDPRGPGKPMGRCAIMTLDLYSTKIRLGYVSLFNSRERDGHLFMNHFDLKDPAADGQRWSCSINTQEGAFRIWDDRGAESQFSKLALTDADRDIVTCPAPWFGEILDVLTRVRAWLVRAGYGEISHPRPGCHP